MGDVMTKEGMAAEKARELHNCYERIEDLQNAVRGLLGLILLIAGRPDISPEIREAMTTSHRVSDAQELLI
jgi:hypothetical protein